MDTLHYESTFKRPLSARGPRPAVFFAECLLCGDRDLRPLATPAKWIGPEVFGPGQGAYRLCRCQRCSFVFVNPRPASETLREFYGGAAYDCHRPDHSATTSAKGEFLLGRVGRYTGHQRGRLDTRRLLDYGCGAGPFLRAARAAGWDAVGFDVGPAALAACRAQGLPVCGDLDELAPGSFAAIFLCHVFEHLEDPRAVLHRLRPLLAPDGRLFIECPNAGSLRARLAAPELSRRTRVDERYRAFPIHLYYFNDRTLPELLRQEGFRVVGVETFGMGLDEYVVRMPAPRANGAAAERRSNGAGAGLLQRARQAAKQAIKESLYGLDLGENILVTSAPAPVAPAP